MRRDSPTGPRGVWRSSLPPQPGMPAHSWQPCPADASIRRSFRVHRPEGDDGDASRRLEYGADPRRFRDSRSTDCESLISTARGVPDLSHSVHVAGCVVGAEPVQETVAILTWTFGDHLHPAVVEIECEAPEAADLQSVCPGEPSEPYLLYSAAYPNDESCIFVHTRTLTGQLLAEHFTPLRHGVQSGRNSLTRSGEACESHGDATGASGAHGRHSAWDATARSGPRGPYARVSSASPRPWPSARWR